MRDYKPDVKPVYSIDRPALHISTGNAKTGAIPAFNTLPSGDYIYRDDGRAVCDVRGTCSGVCDACASDCYAVRSMKTCRPQPVRAYDENTLMLRLEPARLAVEVGQWIDSHEPTFFRIHASGEFDSPDEIALWDTVARLHPDTVFFAYTKRIGWINDYITAHGIADNFRVSLSAWRDEPNNPHNLPVFYYDDGTDQAIADLPHCPAVTAPEKQGGKGKPAHFSDGERVTCAACRHCALAEHGARWAVYAH